MCRTGEDRSGIVTDRQGKILRLIGRIEFWSRGVLGEDARQALAYLIRSRDRRACYVEPRLIARVRHFGRTGEGYLRAPVLEGLSVDPAA